MHGYIYSRSFSRVAAPGGTGPLLLTPIQAKPSAGTSTSTNAAASASAQPVYNTPVAFTPPPGDHNITTTTATPGDKPIVGYTPYVPINSVPTPTCGAGTFYDMTQKKCVSICPGGQVWKPGPGRGTCSTPACPPGTTWQPGATDSSHFYNRNAPSGGACVPTCPPGLVWKADAVVPISPVTATYNQILTLPRTGACVCPDGSLPVNGKCGGTTIVTQLPRCPDGSLMPASGVCPQTFIPPKYCPDGSLMPASGVCPSLPPPPKYCPDGSLMPASGVCPAIPPPVYKPDGGPWPWVPGPTPIPKTVKVPPREPAPRRAGCMPARCSHCGFDFNDP